MFRFEGTNEDADVLARRIRMILQDRHAMHIGELRIRLGVTEEVLQAQCGKMMSCGAVERLRPVDYPRDDHDFFRLSLPVTTAAWRDDRGYSRS